ncbi:hypothetical protein F2Q70_00044145 [Brassica cretica]|uniref:Uncharacterized protein n=1 Tax=Brassica cretica TaxID=69181 RepID=A0A8S9KM57_BRACR|nr:hypothetical protein F2Q70_00044145 [Brassica cretica]
MRLSVRSASCYNWSNPEEARESLKESSVEQSSKWLQSASTEVSGSHPGTLLEEDVNQTNPSFLDSR